MMEYKTLYANDDNTTMVEMTIDGKVLNQAIPNGADQTEFDTNVKQAMAVFANEISVNQPTFTPTVDTVVQVSKLPVIPPADLVELPPAPEPTVEVPDPTVA
jgi:hypothetical protein